MYLKDEIRNLIKEDLAYVRSKLKSEEEIRLLETDQDMPESQRNFYLLKKGTQEQKIAVIQSLARVNQDPDVRQLLTPFILDQLLLWDRQLQLECSVSFQSPDLVNTLSDSDCEILLFKVLEILNHVDVVLFSNFMQNWVKVCCQLFSRINIDTLSNLVLSTIQALMSSRTNAEERAVGYELLFGVIVVHRSDAFRANSEYNRCFNAMAEDQNWRSRKRYLIYVQKLLEATKAPAWKKHEAAVANETKAIFFEMIQEPVIRAAGDENWHIAVEAAVTIHEYPALFTNAQLMTIYKPLIERIMAHAVTKGFEYSLKLQLSRIQGKILDFLYTNDLIDQKLEKQLFTFFKLCVENQSEQEDDKFFDDDDRSDFDLAIEHASESPLTNALLNLPSFYLHLKDGMQMSDLTMRKISSEDDFSAMASRRSGSIKMVRSNSRGNFLTPTSKKPDERVYRYGYQYELLLIANKLSRSEETNISAKEIVASYLHELLTLKSDERHLKRLLSIFESLVASAEDSQGQVQAIICANLSAILDSIYANIDLASYGRAFLAQRNKLLESVNAADFIGEFCARLKMPISFQPTPAFNFTITEQDEEDDDTKTNKIQIASDQKQSNQGSEIKRALNPKFSHLAAGGGMSRSNKDARLKSHVTFPHSLVKYMGIESLTDENLHEVLNQRVLDQLLRLFKSMLRNKAKSYKDIRALLEALSLHMEMFNATAMARAFSEKTLAFLQTAPESIVPSMLQFLVKLVGAQYNTDVRDEVLHKIEQSLSKGNARDRCRYIQLCTQAQTSVDDRLFQQCFLASMRLHFEAESNSIVLKAYLDAFLVFWDHILGVGEDQAIFETYELIRLSANKKWPQELTERAVQVLTKVRTDYEQEQDQQLKGRASIFERRKDAKRRIDQTMTERQRQATRLEYEKELKGFVRKEQQNQRLLQAVTKVSMTNLGPNGRIVRTGTLVKMPETPKGVSEINLTSTKQDVKGSSGPVVRRKSVVQAKPELNQQKKLTKANSFQVQMLEIRKLSQLDLCKLNPSEMSPVQTIKEQSNKSVSSVSNSERTSNINVMSTPALTLTQRQSEDPDNRPELKLNLTILQEESVNMSVPESRVQSGMMTLVNKDQIFSETSSRQQSRCQVLPTVKNSDHQPSFHGQPGKSAQRSEEGKTEPKFEQRAQPKLEPTATKIELLQPPKTRIKQFSEFQGKVSKDKAIKYSQEPELEPQQSSIHTSPLEEFNDTELATLSPPSRIGRYQQIDVTGTQVTKRQYVQVKPSLWNVEEALSEHYQRKATSPDSVTAHDKFRIRITKNSTKAQTLQKVPLLKVDSLLIKRLEGPKTTTKPNLAVNAINREQMPSLNPATSQSPELDFSTQFRAESKVDLNYQTQRLDVPKTDKKVLIHSQSQQILQQAPSITFERNQGSITKLKEIKVMPLSRNHNPNYQKPPLPEYAHGSEVRRFTSQLGIRGSGNESISFRTQISRLNLKPSVQQQTPIPQPDVPALKSSIKTNLMNAHIPPQLSQALQTMRDKANHSRLARLHHFLSSEKIDYQPQVTIKIKLLPKLSSEAKLTHRVSKTKKSFLETQMQRPLKEKFVSLRTPRNAQGRNSQLSNPLDILKEYGTVQQRIKTQQILNEINEAFE